MSDTVNPSGIQPVEYKVLVRLDPVEERTASGLFLARETLDRKQMAETTATLVAVGGMAFADWTGPIPQPGDRVLISKYAGQPPKAGEVENLYRICTDKDVCAILT